MLKLMIKTFISLVLIVLLFFSTIAYTFTNAMKPGFLSDQAREVNLYGRLAGNLPIILEKTKLVETPLEPNELAKVITNSIDGNRFYGFLEEYLNAHVNWLTNRVDRLNFTHSIIDIKESLRTSLTQKLIAKHDALPLCEAQQLRNWSFEAMECKLSESGGADIERLASQTAGEIVTDLPDEIRVNEASPNLVSAQSTVSRLLRLSQIIWLITVAALSLFLVIYQRKAFLSLAAIFLLVGVFQVLFSRIAWDWVAGLVADMFSAGRDTALFAPLIANLIKTVIEVLKTILGNLSIVTLGTGAIFLVLAITFRPRPKNLF